MRKFRNITHNQSKDAGMALALIFLLTGFLINGYRPFKTNIADIEILTVWPFFTGMAVLFINMIQPALFKSFAWLWFNFAELLGNLSSKILLTVIFFLVVMPVGLVRRLWGKDVLLLRSFKKNKNSVFIHRDHLFVKEDMEQPF